MTQSQLVKLILHLAPVHDNNTNFEYHYLRIQDHCATHRDSDVHQRIFISRPHDYCRF